ncbi:sensitivity to high expression protein she9 [Pseudogymnoascus australis]
MSDFNVSRGSDADSPTATDLKQGAASESPASPLLSGLSPNNGELPSATEGRRSHISKRLTNIMDNLQGNIFLASQHLNDLTGYSGIEALKRTITSHEQHLESSQEEVRVSRLNYKQLVADRAASQREVTTLLARKDTWTPIDLERFTSLYRSDHGNEHAVQEAAQRLADAERTAEQAGSRLNAAILARYHEEQIWSDKIRRMSTWGTWGLMGVNVLLFLVFQFGFEPWRRERLTKGFEDKVLAALEREREVSRIEDGEAGAGTAGVEDAEVTAQSPEVESIGVTTPELAAGIVETTGNPEATPSETEGKTPEVSPLQWRQPNTWKEGLVEPCVARVQNLFSEEKVSLRKQDVTLVALEGLATGAAVAGLAVMYILRPN